MKQLFKKTIATLLSLTLILSWAAFARDITVNAGSYATASFYRVQGTDRYDTANKIAAQGWDEASTVVLASGMSYPDALAGAPLAYALDAPILLVTGSSVPASVMQQIYDLGASNIYILGGTAAVSSSIEQELKGKNFTVNRIWGQNRYETSVEVAKTLISIAGSSDEAFVVSGENYPDALAVSPVASLKGAPIVYSNKRGTIDSGSAALLRSVGASRAYVIGGTAAIGSDVNGNLGRCGISSITRISGNSRYDTALKVADHFIDVFTAKSIAFATGENYPDALAGGVFAARKGMPVLLTNSKLNAQDSSSIFLAASAYNDSLSFTENLVAFIEKFQPEEVFVFGGQNAVPNVTIDSYFDGETWEDTTITTTPTTTPTTPSVSGTPLSSLPVGEHFLFGSYEMDGDTSNGAEDIEWRILEKESDRVLVLAEYSVNSMSYHHIETDLESTYITWEGSDIRRYLSDSFYNDAFGNNERSYIQNSYIQNSFEGASASGDPYWVYYCSKSGNDTYDRVFLLNGIEFMKYFEDYHPESTDGNGNGWWLRNNSHVYFKAYAVNPRGWMFPDGYGVDWEYGVRPAMWLEPSTPVKPVNGSTSTTTNKNDTTSLVEDYADLIMSRKVDGMYWSVCDMDGNGVPELLFVMNGKGNREQPVYTYDNGVRQISTIKTGGCWYVPSEKLFVTQDHMGTGVGKYYVYSYSGDQLSLVREISYSVPGSFPSTFKDNGKVISEAEYNKFLDTYCKDNYRIKLYGIDDRASVMSTLEELL